MNQCGASNWGGRNIEMGGTQQTQVGKGQRNGNATWRRCHTYRGLKGVLGLAGPGEVGRGNERALGKRHSCSKGRG